MAAARRAQNAALAHALNRGHFAREWRREREHATKARATRVDLVELAEQRFVVFGVRRALVGKASRAHAGATSERIHLEAAVVGERRQARRQAYGAGFEHGVFFEGLPRLFDAEAGGQHLIHAVELER